MNLFKNIIYSIFAIFLITSCKSDDFTTDLSEHGKKVRLNISASIEVHPTRVDMNDMESHIKCSWNDADRIGVILPGKFNICLKLVRVGDKVSFVPEDGNILEASIGDELIAYYPYRGELCERDFYEKSYIDLGYDGYPSFMSPQDYKERAKLPCILLSRCKIESEDIFLSFEHLFSYVDLKIESEIFKNGKSLRINVSDTEDNNAPDVPQYEIRITFKPSSYELSQLSSQTFGTSMDQESLSGSEMLEAIIPVVPINKGGHLSFNVGEWMSTSGYMLVKEIPEEGMKNGIVYKMSLTASDFIKAEDKLRDSLTAFYKATRGEKWKNNTNWCSDRPVSEWYGIQFNLSSGYILNLSNNNLNGKIPSIIAELKGFNQILLDDNHLTGQIPEEISKLIDLTTLHLERNFLTGDIPMSMSNLINMEHLVLGNSYLRGIDADSPDQTETNNLSGDIFSIIKSWKNLRGLYISGNNFSGELGDLSEEQIRKLDGLDLAQNHFSGKLPPFVLKMMDKLLLYSELNKKDDNHRILYFAIDHNDFTGVVPEEILNHEVAPAMYEDIVPQNAGFGFEKCRHPFFKNNVMCYDGNSINLGETYKNSKWTVFYEWTDSDEEGWLDEILNFQKEYSNKNVQVVGVTDVNLFEHPDGDKEITKKYLEKMSSMPHFWQDGINNIYPKNNFYLLGCPLTPYIWLIDNNGDLIYEGWAGFDVPPTGLIEEVKQIINSNDR